MIQANQIYNLIFKRKIINYSIFLFFCFYFIVGISIYKDYGISTDEPFQRTSGFYWYLWIINNFFNDSPSIEYLKNQFNEMEWSQEMLNGIFLEYGVTFDLLATFIENKFNPIYISQVQLVNSSLIFFI